MTMKETIKRSMEFCKKIYAHEYTKAFWKGFADQAAISLITAVILALLVPKKYWTAMSRNAEKKLAKYN